MSAPPDPEASASALVEEASARQHRLVERHNELDHAHRARAARAGAGGVGVALSLRFLRTAARRLFTPTAQGRVGRVPAPPAGTMAVTLVGHATVMLTTSETRVLTDPMLTDMLVGLRRAEAACLHPDDAAEVRLVLISHAHRDHLHPPSLRRLPREASIVVPPRCGPLVRTLGFREVTELSPGESLTFQDLQVTAVAARHDGARGFGDFAWRGCCGYVVRAPGVTAYFAGDTGYFSGFEEIGRRMRPDVALLPIAGYEPLPLRETHMSPLDAVTAFRDLGAHVLVPIAHGAFPLGYEPLAAPLAWLRQLCVERGLADHLAALRPGGTCLVRRPVPQADDRAEVVRLPVDDPAAVG